MKNYARKTNRSVTRYRTPAMFRLRAVINTQKHRLDNRPPRPEEPKFGK
jgi:hypothetical protein